MIYLIDDKKERQKNLGWGKDKLLNYKDILMPIHTIEEIEKVKKIMFSIENIVLYHESFFDNPINLHKKSSSEIKQDLINLSDKYRIIVVFFSGSISSKNIINKRASLPVSTFYKNLAFFLDSYRILKQDIDLNQIAFGNDFKREKLLELKLKIWNLLFDKKNPDLFVNNEELNILLDEFQKITSLTLQIKDITNEFLKFQINKIYETNE